MIKNPWLMSVALIGLMSVSCVAYAYEHGSWDKSDSAAMCEHRQFSESQMKLLYDTRMKLHESNKTIFEEIHKLRGERHAVLAAETFDKKSFLTITAQIENKHEQLERSRIQAFASIADKFTPEERERLTRMFAHGRHHRGWKHANWRPGEGHEGHEGWHHSGQANDQKDYPSDSPR